MQTVNEPIPIRAGVQITTDFERELLEFCRTSIASYTEDYGDPPTSVAIVLSGSSGGDRATDAWSWDASETRTKLETCSVASAVLLKRAIGDD